MKENMKTLNRPTLFTTLFGLLVLGLIASNAYFFLHIQNRSAQAQVKTPPVKYHMLRHRAGDVVCGFMNPSANIQGPKENKGISCVFVPRHLIGKKRRLMRIRRPNVNASQLRI